MTTAGVDPTTLPSPACVVEQGWANRQDLWDQTLPTLQETLLGFALSFGAAWVVAVLLDFSAAARRGMYPLLVASQTIPIVAVAPLLIIWFGFGLLPKMLVVTLTTFFPLAANLAAGFAATDREAMRLLRSLGAGRWRAFRLVRVPSAMPYFFAGLRVSITYAVVGAVFAEYAGAEAGLGIYMQAQKSAFRTDLVFAAVGVTAALSIALPQPLGGILHGVRLTGPARGTGAYVAERPALVKGLADVPWREDTQRVLLPLHERLAPRLGALHPLWTHNDWHASNLLWGADGGVSAVLDFGMSDCTTAVHDLATAIERNAVQWLQPGFPVREEDAVALVDGYESMRPLSPAESAALPALLPLVHAEFALSELGYFFGVTRSAENTRLAYEYYAGHAEWFSGEPGRRLLRRLSER